MQDLGFYLTAFLTLLFGLLVVANPFSRNPVTSAMFLVLTMVCLAGLFVTSGGLTKHAGLGGGRRRGLLLSAPRE